MSFAVSSTLPATAPTTPTFSTPASARVHPANTTPAHTTTSPVPTTTTTSPVTPVAPAARPLTSTGTLARPRAPARTTHGGGHVSTEAIVLAALAALLLLACAAWAFARARAYEPHWLLSLRHAMAEAGFRMSATWAEFADWVRLGR